MIIARCVFVSWVADLLCTSNFHLQFVWSLSKLC